MKYKVIIRYDKIFYLLEEDQIIILSVIHGRRRPYLIKKRIDGI